jgi:hypothetical protein
MFFSLRIKKCVAPMRIFSVADGCSTVSRRTRMACGLLSRILRYFDNVLVLPPFDAPLVARGAVTL